jgi:transposase
MAGSGVIAHLSVAELGQRYRAARDPVERSQLQIIWLVGQGHRRKAVAQITGYSGRWVAEVVRRYNAEGPEGLGDRRHGNAGAKPMLDAAQRKELIQALHGPPPQGGLWSGPKVAAWIAARTGRKVHPQRGWDYLVKLGFTLKRPRPRHAKASPEAQEAFKKGAARAAGRAAGRPPRSGLRGLGPR